MSKNSSNILGLFTRSVLATLLLFVSSYADASPNELTDLLDRVAVLNISRNGYILGKALTDAQKNTARRDPVEIENPDLSKFKDGGLYIVAEKTTDRVIIMYEQYDEASRKEIRELVGTLFLDFGEPTVFTHDKVIYWAWGQNGKFSSEAFKTAKKKQQPLKILVTVKLNSNLKIMEAREDKEPGRVYYIVSSDPALKLIQSR